MSFPFKSTPTGKFWFLGCPFCLRYKYSFNGSGNKGKKIFNSSKLKRMLVVSNVISGNSNGERYFLILGWKEEKASRSGKNKLKLKLHAWKKIFYSHCIIKIFNLPFYVDRNYILVYWKSTGLNFLSKYIFVSSKTNLFEKLVIIPRWYRIILTFQTCSNTHEEKISKEFCQISKIKHLQR